MEELGLVLSRHQFKDVVRLADNFDRMKTNDQYRKYKPFVPLSGNSKAWYAGMIRNLIDLDAFYDSISSKLFFPRFLSKLSQVHFEVKFPL